MTQQLRVVGRTIPTLNLIVMLLRICLSLKQWKKVEKNSFWTYRKCSWRNLWLNLESISRVVWELDQKTNEISRKLCWRGRTCFSGIRTLHVLLWRGFSLWRKWDTIMIPNIHSMTHWLDQPLKYRIMSSTKQSQSTFKIVWRTLSAMSRRTLTSYCHIRS